MNHSCLYFFFDICIHMSLKICQCLYALKYIELVHYLYICEVESVSSWKIKKRKEMDEKGLKKNSNEKEVKGDEKARKLFKSWKFESECSLIIMSNAHTYVIIYYRFLSSYIALLYFTIHMATIFEITWIFNSIAYKSSMSILKLCLNSKYFFMKLCQVDTLTIYQFLISKLHALYIYS